MNSVYMNNQVLYLTGRGYNLFKVNKLSLSLISVTLLYTLSLTFYAFLSYIESNNA
jgi:hypothetical protein